MANWMTIRWLLEVHTKLAWPSELKLELDGWTDANCDSLSSCRSQKCFHITEPILIDPGPGSHSSQPWPRVSPALALTWPWPRIITLTPCPVTSPVTMSQARWLQDQWLAPGSHLKLAPALSVKHGQTDKVKIHHEPKVLMYYMLLCMICTEYWWLLLMLLH